MQQSAALRLQNTAIGWPRQLLTPSQPEHLHHLVAEMIDHLHRYPATLRFVEGPRGVAAEARPGLLVDLRLEGVFKGTIRVVLTEEVGMADEEALLVVVGIDEPAGDAVDVARHDLAGLGFEDVDAADSDL